jgi:G:T-mismatch repair DNA endonuclease (very short patch repair protein)
VDGIKILHARNGRKYRLLELPHLSLDGFCPEQRNVLEFLGCFWHRHSCLYFRDVTTMCGETLSQRYEQTLARIEQITRAGYQVEINWECEFDEGIFARHRELKRHSLVQQSPLNTRDALYGGRTEAMRFHYRVREGEQISYCDVMSLYSCKYSKFPVGHPVIHVGDMCRDIDAMLRKEGLIKCCILPPKRLSSSIALPLQQQFVIQSV